MVDASTAKLSSMHFHGWELGLKTGLYYLRTKAAADAIKFTVQKQQAKTVTPPVPEPTAQQQVVSCDLGDSDDCITCGS